MAPNYRPLWPRRIVNGAARYLAGESERAIYDFDEALKLAPDSAEIRNARAIAVQANQRLSRDHRR